jgi:hypothetical protein
LWEATTRRSSVNRPGMRLGLNGLFLQADQVNNALFG